MRGGRIFGRCPQRLERFSAGIDKALNLRATVAQMREAALAGADIVNIVTRADTPLFDGALLEPGQHVNAVGYNALSRREIDMTAIRKCAVIVVDSVAVAQQVAGDRVPPAAPALSTWPTPPE